jgi:hypothetical protein
MHGAVRGTLVLTLSVHFVSAEPAPQAELSPPGRRESHLEKHHLRHLRTAAALMAEAEQHLAMAGGRSSTGNPLQDNGKALSLADQGQKAALDQLLKVLGRPESGGGGGG